MFQSVMLSRGYRTKVTEEIRGCLKCVSRTLLEIKRPVGRASPDDFAISRGTINRRPRCAPNFFPSLSFFFSRRVWDTGKKANNAFCSLPNVAVIMACRDYYAIARRWNIKWTAIGRLNIKVVTKRSPTSNCTHFLSPDFFSLKKEWEKRIRDTREIFGNQLGRSALD